MKKDKDETKKPDETHEKPSQTVIQDAPESDEQVQLLSEIESTEVAIEDGHEVSVDPDQEIVIKKPAGEKPWWKRRPALIAGSILLLLVVFFAVPQTRLFALSWVWREDVVITVVDAKNNTPVTDAVVTVAGRSATSDSKGLATVKSVPVGYQTVQIVKSHYQTLSQPTVVDALASLQNRQITLTPTGTPVTLRVVDRLSGKVIPDASLNDSGGATLGRSDKTGRATVVVPTGRSSVKVTVTAGNYLVLATEVKPDTKDVTLVPSGSIYFLSKQSGKIDVVKSNLDGSGRKVIVEGTGDENDQTTTLLASRDWKYLILKAKRAPNKPESLYLINAADESYKVIDETNADFSLVGWSSHRFVYQETLRSVDAWRAKTSALRSFDAATGNTATIDENSADTTSSQQSPLYEEFGRAYLTEDAVVYVKNWISYNALADAIKGKQTAIISAKPDATAKQTIKSYPLETFNFITTRLYSPQELYVRASRVNDQNPQYGEIENGTYKDVGTIDGFDTKDYSTYLMSPSGTGSFWYEERDGKNSLFVGDKNAENKQELASKSEFKPYGWLTDDYLLLQKKDSELYITTKDQLKAGKEPLKVSDYHKVKESLSGYGYGYGGQ